jgi:hypothetical protein
MYHRIYDLTDLALLVVFATCVIWIIIILNEAYEDP